LLCPLCAGLEEGSVKMVSCLTNSREEHMISLPDDESSEEESSDGEEEEEEGSEGSGEGASSEEGGDGSEEAGDDEHAHKAGNKAAAEVRAQASNAAALSSSGAQPVWPLSAGLHILFPGNCCREVTMK
jgi:hypothetical protein